MDSVRKLKLMELGRVSAEEGISLSKLPLVAVLDNFRSGGNVGAFFRTADALGIDGLYLCGITPQPPHPQIHKTAIGSTKSVKWQHQVSISDCLKSLKGEGYNLIGVEQTTSSIHLRQFPWDGKPCALIFGNEVEGLSEEVLPLCDHFLDIQQYGAKHSFNVGVCGGIVLYEATKQFRK